MTDASLRDQVHRCERSPQDRLAHPPRQPVHLQILAYIPRVPVSRVPNNLVENPEKVLDIASHKLYYVNYKIGQAELAPMRSDR